MKTTTKVSEKKSEPSMEDILSSIRTIISGEETVPSQDSQPEIPQQSPGVTDPQAPETKQVFEEDQEILDLIHMLRDDNTVQEVKPFNQASASKSHTETFTMDLIGEDEPVVITKIENEAIETTAEAKKTTKTEKDSSEQKETLEEATSEDKEETPSKEKEPTPNTPRPKENSSLEEEVMTDIEEDIGDLSVDVEDAVLGEQEGVTLSENTISEAAAALDTLTKLTDKPTPKGSLDEIGGKTVDGLMKDVLRPLLKEWLDANLPSLVRTIVTEQVQKIVQQKVNTPNNRKSS